jgi:hypothetical protein
MRDATVKSVSQRVLFATAEASNVAIFLGKKEKAASHDLAAFCIGGLGAPYCLAAMRS